MSQTIAMVAGEPQEFYGVANFLRILESSGPLTIEFYMQGREVAEALDVGEGYAEKFEIGEFDRVRLTSPTDQTVQFITRLGNSVLYDKAPVGDTNIVGSVPLALDAATLAAMVAMARPLAANGNYKTLAALAANTAEVIFTPASNVNGAILLTAQCCFREVAYTAAAFVAKASAPASVIDGEVILQTRVLQVDTGATSIGAELQSAQFIPAGLGLYFISNGSLLAGGAGFVSGRSARFRLL